MNYLCIRLTLENAFRRHPSERLKTIMRWKFYGKIYYPMRRFGVRAMETRRELLISRWPKSRRRNLSSGREQVERNVRLKQPKCLTQLTSSPLLFLIFIYLSFFFGDIQKSVI